MDGGADCRIDTVGCIRTDWQFRPRPVLSRRSADPDAGGKLRRAAKLDGRRQNHLDHAEGAPRALVCVVALAGSGNQDHLLLANAASLFVFAVNL